MDHFKQGRVELGALAVSVGSTFRTDTLCLKTAGNDVNLQVEEAVHGHLIRTWCTYGICHFIFQLRLSTKPVPVTIVSAPLFINSMGVLQEQNLWDWTLQAKFYLHHQEYSQKCQLMVQSTNNKISAIKKKSFMD